MKIRIYAAPAVKGLNTRSEIRGVKFKKCSDHGVLGVPDVITSRQRETFIIIYKLTLVLTLEALR